MRVLDTDALRWVANVLGISAPSTAVQPLMFDDGVLQQVLDVRTILPGLGLQDGWATAELRNTHSSTGQLWKTLDPYATTVLDLGGNPDRDRVWLMRSLLWASIVSGNAVTSAQLVVRYPVMPGIFNNPETFWLVDRVNAFQGNPLVESGAKAAGYTSEGGGRFPEPQALPMYIPPGGIISLRTNGNVAATTIDGGADVLMWVGPRGLRPPGV